MSRRLLSCVPIRFFQLALFACISCTSVAYGQSGNLRGDAKAGARKPSPTLASLPAPKAAGALRILLVVDDWNRSNGAPIYRKLVADAVGGDARAWSTVVVEPNQHGPAPEKLRGFNVVVWYTGDSYGGGANGVSTLSDEDEKTVRRYLQETGGAFILVSPGYLSTRSYGTTWTKSEHPFLKEVAGVTGFADLVQRFAAGMVRTPGGASFTVQAKGSVETQFSAVNPDGAAVVFTAALDPKKTAEGPVPVAVAHAFGGGRFVYVGFSLENVAEGERAKAFGVLLEAATGPRKAVAAASPAPTRIPVAQTPGAQIQTLKPAPPGPAAKNLRVDGTPAKHRLSWDYGGGERPASYDIYRRDPDGWKHLGSRQTAGGKGANVDGYDDLSFVAANSAYRVATVYADGRRGEAEVEYPNPPQPQLPTGLVASQNRWDGIRLQWDRGVARFRVYGPGLPADGYRILVTDYLHRVCSPGLGLGLCNPAPGSGNSYVVVLEKYQLPVGEHEFRVANDYTYYSNAPSQSEVQWPERVAPVSAAVKVRVNAQQPPVVTDVRVEQLGYRRITLHWKPASNPGTGQLYVHATGMGAAGQLAMVRPGNDQWMEFREVPEGTHTIRMTYHYPYEGAGPVSAEVTATVVNMTQTSNDIPNCAGQWVSAVCRSTPGGGGKGKSNDKGGKLGKK